MHLAKAIAKAIAIAISWNQFNHLYQVFLLLIPPTLNHLLTNNSTPQPIPTLHYLFNIYISFVHTNHLIQSHKCHYSSLLAHLTPTPTWLPVSSSPTQSKPSPPPPTHLLKIRGTANPGRRRPYRRAFASTTLSTRPTSQQSEQQQQQQQQQQ